MTQPPPARHLLDQPHHDGSSVYVKPGPYTLDDVVPVRLRVPTSPGVRDVWLRTVRDGEPRMERTRLDRSNGHEDIYVADVLVHNTSTPYRFLLDRPDAPGGYSWLNGSGVWQRDIADAHDFRLLTAPPPPAWLNAGTVYQVFPDRFARSTSADTRPLPSWAVPAEWGSTPAPLPPL
ncbi:MAG: glycoside hydrolase family 13 protein, partial [Cellulomonadaceae bacterium]|nr:glycoside hydrolase family 13 protein [Cellulomonadaceae bacterium]